MNLILGPKKWISGYQFAMKPEDLSFLSRTHMVIRENRLL